VFVPIKILKKSLDCMLRIAYSTHIATSYEFTIMITFEDLCKVQPELLLQAFCKRFVDNAIAYAAELKAEGEEYDCEVDALHIDLQREMCAYVEEYAEAAGLK
jgi:hypothetical protein